VGNAIHNALVAGNCSVFVPWQITEGRPSVHALMVMDRYTPKTYTVMHYSRFVRPGAVRIDAEPGFGAVQVGAFLHEKDGDVTVVAINPGQREEVLELAFRHVPGLALLKAWRTSAQENMQEAGEVTVREGAAEFVMRPLSIVTLTGKVLVVGR
jgi:O-glycosyl hydrolase